MRYNSRLLIVQTARSPLMQQRHEPILHEPGRAASLYHPNLMERPSRSRSPQASSSTMVTNVSSRIKVLPPAHVPHHLRISLLWDAVVASRSISAKFPARSYMQPERLP